MTTMIALVGGQTLPNILPVLHYKPSRTLFFYTSTSKEQYINLKTILEGKKFNVYGIETDPYNIPAIAKTLSDALVDIVEQSSQLRVFNLTGGTKPMSLAAYQIAAQHSDPVIYLQSEKGPNVVDHYNWQDHQLCFQYQEQLPEHLLLRDMLDLHLGQGKDTTGKSRWEVKGPNEQRDHSHLFELAIAQTLCDHDYEAMCGVKGKNNQVDVDVMVRYQNHIGIIEAKTSDSGRITDLKGIRQLSLAMQYLRGTYIRQFLVMNGDPSDDLQMMCDILRIPIISLPKYKRGPSSFTLSQEDSETLLTQIDKVMKEGKPKTLVRKNV